MATDDYSDLYETSGAKHNVDPALLRVIVHQESRGNPKAVSPKGAVGVAQIMPKTAKGLGVDPTDPAQAIDGAAQLLSESLDRNNGDVGQAVGEYHAGPDRKIWGPKTAAYQKEVMAAYGGQPASQDGMSDSDILSLASGASPKASPSAPSSTANLSDDAVLKLASGAAPASAALTSQPATPGTPQKSQVLGLQKGFDAPFDNAAVWLESGLKKLGVDTGGINRFLGGESADQARARHAAYVQEQAQKGVVPGGAGELAGNILGTIPAAFATKNPFIAGAAGGALTTKDPHDLGGTAKDAAFGAAGGKVADMGLNALGGAIAPKLSASVRKLLGEGVHLTPGQIMGGAAKSVEDKLTSFPILGDMIQGSRGRGMESFNIAALNRVLKPLGDSLPKDSAPGHDAVAAVSQKVSKAYNDLLSRVTVQADKTFSANLGKIAADARSALPPARAKQFDQITKDLLTTKLAGNGTMTGDGVKQFESRLGQLIAKFGSAADGDQQILADHLRDVQGEVRDLIGRNNPAVASRLKDVNTAFANLVRVQKAAGSVAADHGVFTPAQLLNAAKASDSSARKNASAQGGALMQDFAGAAKAVMPSKVPDSGTPGRLLMNLITGAGVTGGTALHAINPFALVPAAAALAPYTKAGGVIANKLLTARPKGAQAVRDAVEKLRGPAILGGAAAASQSRQ